MAFLNQLQGKLRYAASTTVKLAGELKAELKVLSTSVNSSTSSTKWLRGSSVVRSVELRGQVEGGCRK